DHLMALAGAARRRDRGATAEHLRAVAGLLPGLLYGLGARRGGKGRTHRVTTTDPAAAHSADAQPAPAEPGLRGMTLRATAVVLIRTAALLAVAADWHSPVRSVLALGFLLFAPGLALTEMLAIREPIQRLALATAGSLAV